MSFDVAAKQTDRETVLLLAVESTDAIKRPVELQSQWQSGVAGAHQVDLDSLPGTVRPAIVTLGVSADKKFTAPYDLKLRRVTGRFWYYHYFSWAGTYPGLRFILYLPEPGQAFKVEDTLIGINTRFDVPPGYKAVGWQYHPQITFPARQWFSIDFTFDLPDEPFFRAGEVIDLSGTCADLLVDLHNPISGEDWRRITPRPLTPNWGEWTSPSYWDESTSYIRARDSWVTTPALDLGLVPSLPTRFGAAYKAPQSSSVSFAAWGRNDAGAAWEALGVVAEGGTLPPCRHYYVRADLQSGYNLPELSSITLEGGDSQFRYFATHADEPVAGALPHLLKVSPLNSRIELLKPPTTGEVSIELIWTREVADLLATGYAKNKFVSVKAGYRGLPEAQYEPVFTGFWHDYDADPQRRTITVRVRDVLKKFAKVRIPAEIPDEALGNVRKTQSKVFSGNVIDALLDVVTEMEIPARYLDRSAFEALRDQHRSGADWQVYRTIGGLKSGSATEYRSPIDADELLNELAVLAGIFLVPMPSGELTPVLFDPQAAPVATLDATFCDFGKISGGQKELYTRQYVYFQPWERLDDPREPEDFSRARLFFQPAIEAAWGERSEKIWLEKWRAPDAAVVALADRMHGWFAEPHATVNCSAPVHHKDILPGAIVAVDNLRLPAESAQWPGYTNQRKMLVMSRRLDVMAGKVQFDLMDLGSGFPSGAGTWVSTLVIDGPATPYGLTNVYTAAGGTPPYTWQTSTGRLTVTGAATVNLDVAGLSGAGTLSATDAKGTTLLRFNVLPPAVQNFLVSQQPDGTRMFTWAIVPGMSGYRIRYSPGAGGAWETMGALHAGLLTASPYETGLLDAGTYTFAIRAVDPFGAESGTPVYIEATLAAPREFYVAALARPQELGWPGVKTDCYVDEHGHLVALDTTTWDTLPATWDAWTSWTLNPVSPIVYEHTLDAGAEIAYTVLGSAIAAGVATLTMATSTDGVAYGGWAPLGFAAAARYVKVRVSVAGDFPILQALELMLSTRPRRETLNDLDTATLTGAHRLGVGDIRLPITKTMQKIIIVSVTLQNVGPGWSWELIDKDPTTGPRLKIYNGNQQPADANLDAVIEYL